MVNAEIRKMVNEVLGQQRVDTIQDASYALDNLQEALEKWIAAATRKAQEGQRLSEARVIYEHTRAEVELETKFNPEIVNAKLKDDQERQLLAYLGDILHRDDFMITDAEQDYKVALELYRTTQIATERAALDESIAAEQLKCAKYRVSMVQQILQSLSI